VPHSAIASISSVGRTRSGATDGSGGSIRASGLADQVVVAVGDRDEPDVGRVLQDVRRLGADREQRLADPPLQVGRDVPADRPGALGDRVGLGDDPELVVDELLVEVRQAGGVVAAREDDRLEVLVRVAEAEGLVPQVLELRGSGVGVRDDAAVVDVRAVGVDRQRDALGAGPLSGQQRERAEGR
jgi:hypothetical protein